MMSYHRRCAGSPGVQAGGVAVASWLECMLPGSLPRRPRSLLHTATRRNIPMSSFLKRLDSACGISLHVGSPSRWHPDKNPANREEAAERFKLVSDSKMCRVPKVPVSASANVFSPPGVQISEPPLKNVCSNEKRIFNFGLLGFLGRIVA